MSPNPHLRLGAEALSHQAKNGVLPIPRPEKREKRLRTVSKPRRKAIGHASPEQRAKIKREGPRIAPRFVGEPVDPAHVTPRTQGGCDHEDCTVGLPRTLHQLYDRGELDILPLLTRAEQAHAVSHLGILGALKRTTGERYVPEGEAA